MSTIDFDSVTAIHLPLSERVLDRLGDILFATDEILDMVSTQKRFPDESARDIERCARGVYDEVNALMKTLCD